MAKDLKALRQRITAAWQIANTWHSELEDAYFYAAPERYAMKVGGPTNTHSRADLFDTTALDAVEDFSGFVSESVHPIDGAGFRYSASRLVPSAEAAMLRQNADHRTNVVRQLLLQDDFPTALAEANQELSFGTRFLRIELAGVGMKLRYTALPAYRFAIDETPNGHADGRFWKSKLKARQLEAQYPNAKWSEDLKRKMRDEPEAEVEVDEALYQDKKVWRYCLLEPGRPEDSEPAQESTHRTPPILVTRWGHTLGQPWGWGPTLRMLPEIKTTNKIVELTLLNLAIAVTGIWQAEDDGVLNPSSIVLEPGMIIPHRRGGMGLRPLEAPGKFELGEMKLDELRMRIKSAHFSDELPDRDRMTAYEIQQHLRQQLRAQRGSLGRLKTEDLDAVLERVSDLADELGLIDDFESARGLMDTEMQGPLSQAFSEIEADKISAFRAETITAFGQEFADVAIKAERAVPLLAHLRGVPSDLIATEAELRKHKQDLAMLAQMMPLLLEKMTEQQQMGSAA